MRELLLTAAAALCLAVQPAAAAGTSAGDLELKAAVMREAPAETPVTGGYLVIVNHGSQADRLVAAQADFAKRIEIHEMAIDGDVMKMRELEDGLEIPAGEAVTLMPGGYHIMFMGLKEALTAGETRSMSLEFEQAGTVAIEAEVLDMKAIMRWKREKAGAGKAMTH